MLQTLGVQFAGVDSLLHGAARLARVGAVGEPAFPDKFADVFEGSADGVVAVFRIVKADPAGQPIKAPTPRLGCGEQR